MTFEGFASCKFEYTLDRGWDLALEDGALVEDPTPFTAVAISLFTWRRATAAELEDAGVSPDVNQGHWADTFAQPEGEPMGSLLWLLDRAKREPETLARAEQYAAAALEWMVADGVAARVEVEARWYADAPDGHVILETRVYKPGDVDPSWRQLWDAVNASPL